MMNKIKKLLFSSVSILFLFFVSNTVNATENIQSLISNLSNSFASFTVFLTYVFYVAAIGFIGGAAFKLKAYRDNPQQNSIGVPVIYFVVGLMLVYAPNLLDIGGTSLGNTGNKYKDLGDFDYKPKGN